MFGAFRQTQEYEEFRIGGRTIPRLSRHSSNYDTSTRTACHSARLALQTVLQEAVSGIQFETATGALVALNVSAGAAVYPDDGETYERLLARADRRMYRDKAQRKKPRTLGVVDIAPHLEDARERPRHGVFKSRVKNGRSGGRSSRIIAANVPHFWNALGPYEIHALLGGRHGRGFLIGG